MKRGLTLLLAVMCTAALTGCSLYDTAAGSDISKFVQPNESAAAEITPPPTDLDVSEAAPEDAGEEVQEPTDPAGLQTSQMAAAGVQVGSFVLDNPILTDSYLNCNGFRFYVPFLWRERMRVEVTTEELDSYLVTTYDCYYVQDDPQVYALMMCIKVVPSKYYYANGLSGSTKLLTDENTGLAYFLMASTEALPSEFTDIDAYSEVYSVLADQDDTIELLS